MLATAESAARCSWSGWAAAASCSWKKVGEVSGVSLPHRGGLRGKLAKLLGTRGDYAGSTIYNLATSTTSEEFHGWCGQDAAGGCGAFKMEMVTAAV